MKANLPLARQDRLIIKELDGELLIYDLDTDKAHCLNQTSARVWKHCDGSRNVIKLRELMEAEARSAVPEEMVWLALAQLEKARLLATAPPRPPRLTGLSRRELVKGFGIAAMALPAIISIVSPFPAHAASCGTIPYPSGCPCTFNSECGPPHNNCLGNGTCK